METPEINKERIREFLMKDGKRFDGRAKEDFREINIETGISKNAEGSARVKIGNTEVIVGIKMDVGTPYPDSPNKGNIITSEELLTLSSPRFESGPPKIESVELARIIDRVIRESKLIEFEKLCIKEGEKVWTVFVDIYSINDDGNLLDAAGLGAVIALYNTKIPEYDSEKERVNYGHLTEVKLPLKKDPVFSITIYKIADEFILDPDREEEDTIAARITLGRGEESIHSIQKGENGKIKIDEFEKIMELSKRTYKTIFKNIKKYI